MGAGSSTARRSKKKKPASQNAQQQQRAGGGVDVVGTEDLRHEALPEHDAIQHAASPASLTESRGDTVVATSRTDADAAVVKELQQQGGDAERRDDGRDAGVSGGANSATKAFGGASKWKIAKKVTKSVGVSSLLKRNLELFSFRRPHEDNASGDGRTLSELLDDGDLDVDDIDVERLPKRQRRKVLKRRLRELQLKKRNLYTIPEDVMKSKKLEKLDVSWNQLETISEEMFGELRELREVDVGFNNLTYIPESIEECEFLDTLICRHNKIRFLPGSLHALVSLRELDASNNTLVQFPHEVRELVHLERLDLSHNEIERVGKTLGTVPALEELCLQHNTIPALPTEIGRLNVLKILRINDNKLTELPKEVSMCTMLVLLDIGKNQIRALPKELCRCARLRVLRANDNQISTFGRDFSSLRKLDTLDLSDNQLTLFDVNMEKWRRLVTLDLSNNDLTVVSSRIGFLETLKNVGLDGNRKLVIPPRVVTLGTHAIKSYLRTVAKEHDTLQKRIEIFNSSVAGSTVGSSDNFDYLLDHEYHQKTLAAPLSMTLSSKSVALSDMLAPIADVLSDDASVDQTGTGGVGGEGDTGNVGAAVPQDIVEKRIAFQKSMKLTYKVLEEHDIMYGQSAIRRIQLKRNTGIINLYGCGMGSLPPDVSEVVGIRILDVTENNLTLLDMTALDYDKLLSLSAAYNDLRNFVATAFTPLRVLNLAFNELESINDTVSNMPDLRILYLSGNRLTSLPMSFESSTITDIYFGENAFRVFPECVCHMKNLKRLAFPCNHIESLPKTIGMLSKLVYLDGSFNKLTSLPRSFAHLAELAEVNLSFNPLGTVFPDEIGYLENVRDLNLDYTKIVTAPVGIGNLKSIEILRMEGNELEYPFNALYGKNPLNMVKFFKLGLTHLDLSRSGIHELPSTIGRLTELEELDLSNNSITVLPVELGMCAKLKVLKLDGNPLVSPFKDVCKKPYGYLGIISLLDIFRENLDFSGCQLSSFEGLLERHAEHCLSLDVSGNVLETLPSKFCEFSRLTKLILESNSFFIFPMEVCALGALEELYFQNNRLEELPSALFTMPSLRMLVLDGNNIRGLPDRCTSPLEVLTIANNELRVFPRDFCTIKSLRQLNLRMNQLRTFPQNVGELECLEALDISINELKYLPDSLIRCSYLHTLVCDNNNLIELPPDISELRGLQHLLCSNNRLTTLPSDITQMAVLEQMHLHGNPLPETPYLLNCRGRELVHTVTNAIVSKLVEELYDLPFELTVPYSEEAQNYLTSSALSLSLLSTMHTVADPMNSPPTATVLVGEGESITDY